MRRLGVLALLGACLITSGFGTAAPVVPPPFASGQLVVAGYGVRAYSPSGRETHLVAQPSGPFGVRARAAALSPGGKLLVGGERPTVLAFNSSGISQGSFGAYPDGFRFTAMDASDSHLYVAITDGGFLDEISRSTLRGITEFPFAVESRVTALDIASDDCSLFYATAQRGIRRLDVCQRTPSLLVSNLAARDIALLPDSTLLVVPTSGRTILRLGPDGVVVRRYDDPRVKSWQAVAVTPDGASFWAATAKGAVYRFSLTSGAVQRRIHTIFPVAELLVAGAPQGPAPAPGSPKQEGSLALDGVPTLTGEGLVAQANGRPTPPQQCTAPKPATMEFSPPGQTTAVGPYPGEFTATQTASIGKQTIAQPSGVLGVNVGRILSIDGRFDIRVPNGPRVQGTLSLPGGTGTANTGACLVFQDQVFPNTVIFGPTYHLSGYYRSIHARRLDYHASIQTGGRTYFDNGETALFTDEYYLTHRDGALAGEAYRLAQSFRSRRQSVTDSVESKADLKEHAVVVSGNRRTAVLRIRWPRASDVFDLLDIRLEKRLKFRPLGGGKLKPGKLKPGGVYVRTTRKGRMLNVVVTKLKPGELRFTIGATRLSPGATTVETALQNPSPG